MYDYHSHSNFSDDSTIPMEEMVEAAYQLDLKEIAITDHFDPDYPDTTFPFHLDFPAYHDSLERIKALYHGKIKVIRGMEIGIQHGETLKKCSQAANSYDYDFLIGSFHCALGFDLVRDNFYQDRSAESVYEAFYRYMYDCLKEYKDYDVVGHFNIIDRYAPSMAKPSCYMDIVEAILKIVINDGKGLEINTSSFRYGMGERTTPSADILRLYRDLGGEIITTGSDAHRPPDIGYRLDYAEFMLQKAGFQYLSTFEKRKPSFQKLSL